MIKNSKEKTVWAVRNLQDAPLPEEARVDVTLFANYYGTVKQTQQFNDPQLYTTDGWFTRFLKELAAINVFRRKYRHAKNR